MNELRMSFWPGMRLITRQLSTTEYFIANLTIFEWILSDHAINLTRKYFCYFAIMLPLCMQSICLRRWNVSLIGITDTVIKRGSEFYLECTNTPFAFHTTEWLINIISAFWHVQWMQKKMRKMFDYFALLLKISHSLSLFSCCYRCCCYCC